MKFGILEATAIDGQNVDELGGGMVEVHQENITLALCFTENGKAVR
jgi:hypothetical protein